MAGIPIIGEIIDLMNQGVTWIILVAPPYLKLAIFFAILTFSVTILATLFSFLNISHRIFQPQICDTAKTYLSNYSLAFSGDQVSGTSVAGSEEYVNSCVMSMSNNTCGDCTFIQTGIPDKLSLLCYSMSNPFFYRPMCAHDAFTIGGLNTTYFAYCTQSQGGHALTTVAKQEEYSNALTTVAKCKNMGFDFLDYKLLFVATMVTFLGGFCLAYRKT